MVVLKCNELIDSTMIRRMLSSQTKTIGYPMLFMSGHRPIKPDGTLVVGKIGRDLTVHEGHEAARMCGLSMISTLRDSVGLDNIVQIHKITGYVNCTEDFPTVGTNMSDVIDGCSDIFHGLGERPAQMAVGVNGLSGGAPVEIEAIVEVRSPSDGLLGK